MTQSTQVLLVDPGPPVAYTTVRQAAPDTPPGGDPVVDDDLEVGLGFHPDLEFGLAGGTGGTAAAECALKDADVI